MRRFSVFLTVASFVAPSLGAQVAGDATIAVRPPSAVADTVVASEGSRVRLSTRALQDRSAIGTLASVHADSVWLRHEPQTPPAPFARSALTRLEVSGGHPGLARRSAVGALIGATGGAVLGFALGGGGQCLDCAGGQTGVRAAVSGFFGLLGGFTGMLVGAGTIGPEVWHPARLVTNGP